ncbi:MAG TPA: tetratricopeptide repeat protein [Acidobacteriaceae bacterium]
MINAGLKMEPKAALLYLTRGILYVQLAQFDQAQTDFEKADALDPGRSIASAAQGLVALQEKDPDKALATLRKELSRKPDDAYLLDSLADLLTQRGPEPGSAEFREAMEAAKKAVALRPSLGSARDALAKFELAVGENEAAAEQCRKALEIDPKDQTALYRLIAALRKSGKHEDIPGLVKQLAALRMEGTREEDERNRFKLIEENSSTTEKPQPQSMRLWLRRTAEWFASRPALRRIEFGARCRRSC